jgi:hypothetical protein
MERQLKLLEPDEPDSEWQLDDKTKEVGRRGVAGARAALEAARRHPTVDERRHNAA